MLVAKRAVLVRLFGPLAAGSQGPRNGADSKSHQHQRHTKLKPRTGALAELSTDDDQQQGNCHKS